MLSADVPDPPRSPAGWRLQAPAGDSRAPDLVGIAQYGVLTTQIAPTILSLLGIDPNSLRAVRIDHTRTLPAR